MDQSEPQLPGKQSDTTGPPSDSDTTGQSSVSDLEEGQLGDMNTSDYIGELLSGIHAPVTRPEEPIIVEGASFDLPEGSASGKDEPNNLPEPSSSGEGASVDLAKESLSFESAPVHNSQPLPIELPEESVSIESAPIDLADGSDSHLHKYHPINSQSIVSAVPQETFSPDIATGAPSSLSPSSNGDGAPIEFPEGSPNEVGTFIDLLIRSHSAVGALLDILKGSQSAVSALISIFQSSPFSEVDALIDLIKGSTSEVSALIDLIKESPSMECAPVEQPNGLPGEDRRIGMTVDIPDCTQNIEVVPIDLPERSASAVMRAPVKPVKEEVTMELNDSNIDGEGAKANKSPDDDIEMEISDDLLKEAPLKCICTNCVRREGKKETLSNPCDEKLTCSTCSMTFVIKEELESHQIIHSEKHRYKCILCNVHAYIQKIYFIRHLTKGHGLEIDEEGTTLKSRGWKCHDCQINSESYGKFIEHQQSHSSKCVICGSTSYQQIRDLRQHMARDHGIELKKLNKRNYQGIMHTGTMDADPKNEAKEEVLCPLCGQMYATKISLWKHMKKQHNDYRYNQITETNDRILCNLCGRTYASRDSLLVHKENTHKDYHRNQAARHKSGLLCQACGLSYSSISSLKTHIRNEHKGCDQNLMSGFNGIQ